MDERLTKKRPNNTGYWSDIRKDKLIDALGPFEDLELTPAQIKGLQVQLATTERKTARWLNNDLNGSRCCSLCRRYNFLPSTYCPWCGAEMGA